jgi:predicted O-methyltransferase YrrM/SAM-dependent methyltransferase
MRDSVKDYVRICAETVSIPEPIYEFGSLQVPEQQGYADLRPLFLGKKYVGADMRKGVGVHVFLNLHQVDLPSESVGTVLVLGPLKHVEFPSKAMSEIHRILKPNGILIMSSVMNFPIHDYPSDYWRFTPQAFKTLLKPFATSFVTYAGEDSFPHTIVGIAFKGPASEEIMYQIKARVRDWKRRWSRPTTADRRHVARLLLPPLFVTSVRLARKSRRIMREKGLRAFCRRFVRFALRKASRLPGSDIIDIAFMAAKLRVAERRCHDPCDYFRLIEHTRGIFRIRSLAAAQKETEIIGLLGTASKLPVKSALEIGTGNGGTFYMLCKAAESNAILLTVDPENDWKRVALLRSFSKHGQKIHVIRSSSQDQKTIEEVRRVLGSRRLDLLFIDGDHSLAGVTTDFELYSKLVRHRGIIAMHDILPDFWTRYGIDTMGYTGDVPRFWNGIKSKWKSREIVEDHQQDGHGIGIIEWASTAT